MGGESPRNGTFSPAVVSRDPIERKRGPNGLSSSIFITTLTVSFTGNMHFLIARQTLMSA